jgi:hypothetical protein
MLFKNKSIFEQIMMTTSDLSVSAFLKLLKQILMNPYTPENAFSVVNKYHIKVSYEDD